MGPKHGPTSPIPSVGPAVKEGVKEKLDRARFEAEKYKISIGYRLLYVPQQRVGWKSYSVGEFKCA